MANTQDSLCSTHSRSQNILILIEYGDTYNTYIYIYIYIYNIRNIYTIYLDIIYIYIYLHIHYI